MDANVSDLTSINANMAIYFGQQNIIRIYYECEGWIENSASWLAVWHHEACRVMTNGDPEGQIFISYPHTNNVLFFLLFIYLLN